MGERITAAGPGRWRVGLLAPPALPVPPVDYGGTEAVVHALAGALQRLGCEVRLAAAGTLPGGFAEPVGLDLPRAEAQGCELAHAALALEHFRGCDLIHDHTKMAGALLAPWAPVPVLTTVHNDWAPSRDRVYRARDHAFAFLSRAQARRYPGIPALGVVPNGIDLRHVPFRASGRAGYLLFLGRFSRVKGPALAIAAAREAGVPIVLAGTVDPADTRYFELEIAPAIDGRAVRLVGPVGGARKWALLSRARALLAPHRWEEPFGLTMIEALACGTPVVTGTRGAAPEIVQEGVTGWLADDLAGLVTGISRVDALDPYACRASVDRRFTADAMARGYLALYDKLLAGACAAAGGPKGESS